MIKEVGVFTSRPVTVTASPQIGDFSRTDEITHVNVTWFVIGQDTGLTLGQAITVTWTVSYVKHTECSGVAGTPSVKPTCTSTLNFNTCTTKVVKVSKFSKM